MDTERNFWVGVATIGIEQPAIRRADVEIRFIQLGRGAWRHYIGEVELANAAAAKCAGVRIGAQKENTVDEPECADMVSGQWRSQRTLMLDAGVERRAAEIIDTAVVLVLLDRAADDLGPGKQLPGVPDRIVGGAQEIERRIDGRAKICIRCAADLVTQLRIQGEVHAIG